MPSFFSLYQDYRKDPRSIELSKKKYRELHKKIAFYYNNWNHRQPVQYQRFTDDAGETHEVRIYPDSFVPKMRWLIIDFCERYKMNLAANEVTAKKTEAPPPGKTAPRKRTRKPIPAYTTKK